MFEKEQKEIFIKFKRTWKLLPDLEEKENNEDLIYDS